VERAELAEVIALEPCPVGPGREPNTAEGRKAAANMYRQGAHLHVGMQEARAAGAGELDTAERAIEADPAILGDADSAALQAAARMSPVEDVLRRYHPDFDQRSRGEKIELLMLGARRWDAAWRTIDAFAEFVQGGRAEGRAKRKPPDPELDLRDAELADALGLEHREIGEVLRVPRTEADDRQGGQRAIGQRLIADANCLTITWGRTATGGTSSACETISAAGTRSAVGKGSCCE